MLKYTCDFDFGDVDAAFQDCRAGVIDALCRVGEEAVDDAVENGDYRDVTGNLRRSNKYAVDEENLALTVYNDAPYAADVEARGHNVLKGTQLRTEAKLQRGI